MSSVWQALDKQLLLREQQHLMRKRAVVEPIDNNVMWVNGQRLHSFCSNDYLGLANHPKVVEAFIKAAQQYGVGSGASHLVSGHSIEHQRLEEQFALSTGRSRALLFSTGYMANIGIITALLDQQDAVFEDKLNHASLIDGGLLSGARFQRYLHNDMPSLEKRLAKSDARRKLICVDGVFSMDGDTAKLPELVALAKQYDALLMVDDAHGLGVLGKNGLGCCDEFSLSEVDVPILMCTLGKALGTFGALVAGSNTLIETLVQFARPYIYTTALPPAVAAATTASLQLLQEEAWRREHLQSLLATFRQGAEALGLPIMLSNSPIQPLLIGDEALAIKWQLSLKDKGFWITAIRTPTVAKGAARLRITINANHSKSDIESMLDALAVTAKELPLMRAVA